MTMRLNVGCTRRRQQQILFFLVIFIAVLTVYIFFGSLLASWATHSIVPIAIAPSRPTSDSLTHDNLSLQDNRNILLVSAFFPLSKSKHSITQYSQWLSKFLAQITTPVYFYCPPSLEDTVRLIRGDLPIVIDTRFENAFEIPPLLGRKEEYDTMWEKDREKDRHNPELYAIWAAKPYLLADALEKLYPKSSSPSDGQAVAVAEENRQILGFRHGSVKEDISYAFWTDAGSFRKTHSYADWPSLERLDEIWKEGENAGAGKVKKEDLVFFPVQRLPEASMSLWIEAFGPVDNDVSEGSFFGGPPQTAAPYADAYYAYHDYYLSQSIFVGKDQTLINSLFLLFPERFITMWHGDPLSPLASHAIISSWGSDASSKSNPWSDETRDILGKCDDQWYYYQFFLASSRERERMATYWLEKWDWTFWRKEWWTEVIKGSEGKEKCRVAKTLDMLGFLRRAFGKDWMPPRRSVAVDF